MYGIKTKKEKEKMKISENTSVSMPVKNMLMIIAG
jgi:hypothetical protein